MISIGLRRAFACVLATCSIATLAAEPARFGVIEWTTGQAEITNARGMSRAARATEPIVTGETVQTGAGGEVHIRTEDAAFLAIRQNSHVRIDSYLAAGGREDNVAMSLLRGAMRSVTGWIGRKNSASYTVRTPTATVGIRGTDHETVVVPPHNDPNLPAPGTYDKVNSGGTTLKNAGGEIAISANQSAHAPHDAKMAPRLLDRAPGIFRPGMNESRIEMRKMELARDIEARVKDAIKDGVKDPKELKEVAKDAVKDTKESRDAKTTRDAKDDSARKPTDRTRRKPADR